MKSSVNFSSYLPNGLEEWDLDLYVASTPKDAPQNLIVIYKSDSTPADTLEVDWRVSATDLENPGLTVFEIAHIESFSSHREVNTVQVCVTTNSGAWAWHTFDLAQIRLARPPTAVKII